MMKIEGKINLVKVTAYNLNIVHYSVETLGTGNRIYSSKCDILPST